MSSRDGETGKGSGKLCMNTIDPSEYETFDGDGAECVLSLRI